MNKSTLLGVLAQIEARENTNEMKDETKIEVMMHLLRYINDVQITEAVEAIPF